MEYKIIISNGEVLKLLINANGNVRHIQVFNENEEIVASAAFKIDVPTAFLNRIEIENVKYSHMGIASKLMKFIERLCMQKCCTSMEGKFYPFGELGDYARDFYTKNGYQIYKEDYETYIYKNLDKKLLMEESEVYDERVY